MRRILLIGLGLTIIVSLSLALDDPHAQPRVSTQNITEVVPIPGLSRTDDCFLAHYDTTSGWTTYVGWYWRGEVMKNYFDPADCEAYLPPSPYPFQIDSVWVPIYFTPFLPAGTYTFGLDIECADLTGQNPYQCPHYPGLQVYYTTFQVYYDGVGNYLFQDMIPVDCCMGQPFFLSLEFVDSPNPLMNPGLLFDTSDVEDCIQWYNYPGEWTEWHDTALNCCFGNWVKVLYGEANASCEPVQCPGACEHQPYGDLCESPFELPGVMSFAARHDLCEFCNDYDLSPCTGEPSNAQDAVFAFTWNCQNSNGNYIRVEVNPVGMWDISVALMTECGDFGPTSCLTGEDANGPGWPEIIEMTGVPDGTYYIVVSGWMSNCGMFDICVQSDCPLPVELQYFAGFAGDRQAKLTWTTASETDNDHFYLLRSTDNRQYHRASGNIPATNSAQGATYSHIDNFLSNQTTYYYKLVDVDINDNESVNDLVVTVTPTFGSTIVPDAYKLHQNYPNPFNPITTIAYDLKEDGHVTLTIFDIIGRKVVTLVNQEQRAASYRIEYDASKLASGIYFYQLKVNDFSDLKKMVLLK
jgi:hypothetical protein